jgi:hypothetical protein
VDKEETEKQTVLKVLETKTIGLDKLKFLLSEAMERDK